MGTWIDDRNRIQRAIGDAIRHAEKIHAASIIEDASSDGAMDDRPGSSFHRQAAGDRSVKDEPKTTAQGRGASDRTIKRDILLDRKGALDAVVDSFHIYSSQQATTGIPPAGLAVGTVRRPLQFRIGDCLIARPSRLQP